VALTLHDGIVTQAAVAITALAPTIHRVVEAEAALVGTDGNPGAIEAASEAAAAAARPIGDVRASVAYRRAMAVVITRRAIQAALARARGETVVIPASESTYGS
jgi:CO/xanthine dehydrogenase FAD-binding subunit